MLPIANSHLHCQRCGKRLSKKSARLINGKVVCSACMWKPTLARDAQGDRNPEGGNEVPSRSDESPVRQDAPK